MTRSNYSSKTGRLVDSVPEVDKGSGAASDFAGELGLAGTTKRWRG